MTDWNNPLFSDSDTVDERAKKMGLKVYDTDKPQQWFDAFLEEMGQAPYQVVWSYDQMRIFGEPVAVTKEMEKLLELYQQKTGRK